MHDTKGEGVSLGLSIFSIKKLQLLRVFFFLGGIYGRTGGRGRVKSTLIR